MRSRLLALCVPLLAIGCGGQAADHESLGDRAYSSLDFAGALVEYRLKIVQEPENNGLRAKAGAAALRSRDYLAAAEEFAAIVSREPDNAVALAGLNRSAEGAMGEGNREALSIALDALGSVDGEGTIARYAVALSDDIGTSTPQRALDVLPAAAAGATDSRVQDSLIYEYARVLVRSNDCPAAVGVFEGLVRRGRNASIAERATAGLARCALLAGRRELQLGHPQEAIGWFERAIVGGGDSDYALAAYLGLGDAMFSRGEFVEAADAYFAVVDRSVPGDSLYQRAVQKLNQIGDAGTVDERKEF